MADYRWIVRVEPDSPAKVVIDERTGVIVIGDDVRLRQVIGNLMSNALVHTPDGTPVEVRILPGTPDGEGASYKMSAGLAPLERHREKFIVIRGLTSSPDRRAC